MQAETTAHIFGSYAAALILSNPIKLIASPCRSMLRMKQSNFESSLVG
jgi:hypothetical protein